MADTNTFNQQTAENAHNIYVVFQSGDNKVTPAVLNFDPETAGYYRGHMALGEEALDPAKLTQAGLDDVNLKGTYFSEPAFTEAVRIDYNTAMQTAVSAYNDVAKELGIETFRDPEAIQNLVSEHSKIQNWYIVDAALDGIVDSAQGSPLAQDLKDQIDNANAAREMLNFHGQLAQQTYDLYNDVSDPVGPETSYNPIDFDQWKYADPIDSVQARNFEF